MRKRIGKFEIVRQIGKGAMGEVYLGRDPALGREVAIKTILSDSAFGEDAQARFEREARASGSINHPNVVTVYEFGQDEGLHYLVVEYVEGQGLDALMASGQLSRPELMELVAQACDGLGAAHDQGIVHRDVKPGNILVSLKGRRPQAKLMDFGIARMTNQQDLTAQGTWMGTVGYLAPEYLDTGKAGFASDLFAMGVILYEIVTGGRKPFPGDTATLVLNAILRAPPVPLTTEEALSLDPRIQELLDRALAKDPADRYEGAELLASAIRAILASARSGPPGPGRERAIPHQAVTEARPLPSAAPAPAPVPERILTVGKGGKGQCMSLRVALRQAEPGMRIHILPGVYRESVVVDRDVVLAGQGEPGEVVLEGTRGPCVTLSAAQAQLSGLTIRAGGTPEAGPALLVLDGKAVLEACHLEAGTATCVVLEGGRTNPRFKDCSIRGSGPVGLRLASGAGAHLEGCTLEGPLPAAILVETGAQVLLARCRIANLGGLLGLVLRPGAQAWMEDGQVTGQKSACLEVGAEARVHLRRSSLRSGLGVGLLVLERGQAVLEECELSGHAWSALHAVAGSSVQARQCRIQGNGGYGVSALDGGLVALEGCDLSDNGLPALFIHRGATLQAKDCRIHDGRSLGVVCSGAGRGVLDGCELYGNAQTGARVEAGGSLLLLKCTLRDGRDTGLLLLEDAEATLEACVVHGNARGGILLAKDAAEPILRGGNRIDDDLLRVNAQGAHVKVMPVRRR
jgi:F-box protein 11